MTLDMLFWGMVSVVLGSCVLGLLWIVIRPYVRARRERKINKAINGYAGIYRGLSPQRREAYRLDLYIECCAGFFRNQDAINRAHAAIRVLNEERVGAQQAARVVAGVSPEELTPEQWDAYLERIEREYPNE